MCVRLVDEQQHPVERGVDERRRLGSGGAQVLADEVARLASTTLSVLITPGRSRSSRRYARRSSCRCRVGRRPGAGFAVVARPSRRAPGRVRRPNGACADLRLHRLKPDLTVEFTLRGRQQDPSPASTPGSVVGGHRSRVPPVGARVDHLAGDDDDPEPRIGQGLGVVGESG